MSRMEIISDVLAIIGVLLVVAGVYVEFGIGWAFIISGALTGAIGINIARITNASNRDADN